MKRTTPTRKTRRDEEGYALVLIMFFLALLVLSTVVAAPTVISSVQREKEAELVWRGKQYMRGVRLYYLKMRRYPTKLDDLTKPTNGVRFMRQAYKDPMNTVDGSWRLIYVGPNGQLIGSLNRQFLGAYGPTGLAGAAPAGMQNTAFGGSPSSLGTGFGSTAGSTAGNAANSAPSATNTGDANATNTGDANAQNPDQSGTPQPLATMDASNTIGGNIIGVGSKVSKKSFLWYQKAKDYRHFEFIWDPTQDLMMGGASRGIGTPIASPSNTGAPGTVAPQNPNANQNPVVSPSPGDNLPLQAPPNQ